MQKNPSQRLSFDTFFKHAFLSGQPLGRLPEGRLQGGVGRGGLDGAAGGIEQDWLLLDSPADGLSPGAALRIAAML